MIRHMNYKAAAARFHRQESGATMVEFAVSLILFMSLFLAVIEFSLAIYSYDFVSYGAQQAARYAIVRGSRWKTACASTNSYDCVASAGNIQDYVRGLASPGIVANSINVTTNWPGTTPTGSTTGCSPANANGCVVNINVTYPFNLAIPFAASKTLQFSASSQMVIED
jgi:Flp pilus assembly protein TadG